MSGIVLHHATQARSFRSLWLLHEIGIDFELVVHPFGKNLRAPEYLAKHPLGRVPALEIDGRKMFETGAICEYLCETRAPALWRAPGNPERADWLQWLHYAETIAVHGANLTQQHIVIYDDADRSPLLMQLEAKRLAKAVGVLEQVLSDHDYMLETGFSGVDTAMGYSVDIATRFITLDEMPAVSDYLDRLRSRTAYQRAIERDGDAHIYKKAFYVPPIG